MSELIIRQQRNPELNPVKLALLRYMLGHTNPHVHVFSRAADRLDEDLGSELNIVLTAGRNRDDEWDPRRYNLPTAN